jgi:hypothetical protein
MATRYRVCNPVPGRTGACDQQAMVDNEGSEGAASRVVLKYLNGDKPSLF